MRLLPLSVPHSMLSSALTPCRSSSPYSRPTYELSRGNSQCRVIAYHVASHDEQSGGSVIPEVAGRAIRVVRTDVIERRARHRSVRACARAWLKFGNHSYVDDLHGRYTRARQPCTVSRRKTIRPSGVDQYP